MAVKSADLPARHASAPAIRRDSFARRLIGGVIAVSQVEMRKLRRNPGVILGRSIHPLLWLLVFGTVLGRVGLPLAGSDYRAYLAPAVLAQVGVFFSIPVGLSVIWEKDVGQLPRLLATPLPNMALVLGKAVGACVLALAQATVVLAVLVVLSVPIDWSVLGSVAMLGMLMLGTAAFASLAMALAAVYRDRDRFVAVTQTLLAPLVFVSCALYPLSFMPSLLRIAAEMNPLTYEIQAMRQMFLGVDDGSRLWLDFLVVIAFLLTTLFAAVRFYPKAIR